MIKIKTIAVGILQTNCHIIIHEATHKAIIVDPGEEGERIIQFLEDLGAVPQLIINTHGHGDHIGANSVIKEKYNVPIAIHQLDSIMLENPEVNLSAACGFPIVSPPADRLLEDGDEIELKDEIIKALHTPGHSPGGISLYLKPHLFPGDVLFKDSVGRTDFPGCSHERLVESIQNKIMTLPDDTIVYPGHGPSTSIGAERRNNPFLCGII